MNLESIKQKALDFIKGHPDFDAAAKACEQIAFDLADEAVRAALTSELGNVGGELAGTVLTAVEKVIEEKMGVQPPAPVAPPAPRPTKTLADAASANAAQVAARFARR